MNTEQYMARKQELSTDTEVHRDTCYTCWKKKSLCLCSSIKSFHTNTEIILLMHPKEARKQKLGTGRMSLACLENSQMFCAVNFDEHKAFQKLINDPKRHVVLVYPSPEANDLDGPLNETWKEQILEKNKTLTLLLIDATWPCAKKMMKLSSCLHTLPMASFKETYEGRFLIKHQPNNQCLSTLETIVHALNGLKTIGLEEREAPVDNLWAPFNEMLKFQIRCAEDPSIPSNRGKKSKKENRPTTTRVREKKNRLFYWDLGKSTPGSHKIQKKEDS